MTRTDLPRKPACARNRYLPMLQPWLKYNVDRARARNKDANSMPPAVTIRLRSKLVLLFHHVGFLRTQQPVNTQTNKRTSVKTYCRWVRYIDYLCVGFFKNFIQYDGDRAVTFPLYKEIGRGKKIKGKMYVCTPLVSFSDYNTTVFDFIVP